MHFFDLVRWITGQDPVSVSVTGSALVDPAIREFGDVDTSVATLTLLPLILLQPLDWSVQHAASLFGSLIGHIIYGLIVGLVYAAIDRLWVGFFTNTDPINREPEGSGVRPLVAKNCDFHAVIPMARTAIGSFNVSVAAALALYEVRRQRTR